MTLQRYCTNCGSLMASDATTCGSCSFSLNNQDNPPAQADPASQSHMPHDQGAGPQFHSPYNSNFSQFPNGSNNQPRLIPLVLFGLVGLGVLIVAAFFIFNSFFNTGSWVEGKDCKPVAQADLEDIESAGVAEIIKRGYDCEFVNGRHIRVSKSDYSALVDLLVADFKNQSKASKENLLYKCQIFGYDIGVDDISDGIAIGENVFILDSSAARYPDYYLEPLEKKDIKAEFAGSLCDKLAEHLDIPSATDLRNLHSGDSGNFLPTLPIPAVDYIFLNGYIIAPSRYDFGSDCWIINYEVAFKGEWVEQSVDNIFNDDNLYETIKREIVSLYPDEGSSEGFYVDITVYKYNGKNKSYDYYETPAEDTKEYSRDVCQ